MPVTKRATHISMVLATILLNSPVAAEEREGGAHIISIPNRSDDLLNDSRIVCAFGKLPSTDEEGHAKYGGGLRNAPKFCPAIIAEAIKRGNDADLYSRIHVGHAKEELQAVLLASAKGQETYVSTRGDERPLRCEMAFDAGFIYGSANPEQPILEGHSPAQIDAITEQCFNQTGKTGTAAAFWAGAWMGQRM